MNHFVFFFKIWKTQFLNQSRFYVECHVFLPSEVPWWLGTVHAEEPDIRLVAPCGKLRLKAIDFVL